MCAIDIKWYVCGRACVFVLRLLSLPLRLLASLSTSLLASLPPSFPLSLSLSLFICLYLYE